MQGQKKIIEVLNALLADELTAINQYVVHAEMCDNWGYGRLHEALEKTAIDEMKHAEKLIARILFLEGRPIVSQLNPIHIGDDVAGILENDRAGEQSAILAYNAAIQLCQELKDGGTRELLEDILEDEERHIDWREAQNDQIAQMGIANYLLAQAH
jgi:bacterioferritin